MTFDELREAILDDLETLWPEVDREMGSDAWVWATVLAGLDESIYAKADGVEDQATPLRANANTLAAWGEVKQIPRLPSEDLESYRNRILQSFRSAPSGGTEADYERWALESGLVNRVKVLPIRKGAADPDRGAGTVDVCVWNHDTVSFPDPSPIEASVGVRAGVADYIESVRPVTADVEVITVAPDSVSVQAVLHPLPGYEWDWSGTRAPTGTSFVGDTLVHVTGHGLSTGMRVVISRVQYTITDVVDADSFEVDPPLQGELGVGSPTIRPGGPLWQPANTALRAYFGGLEPLQGVRRNRIIGELTVAGVEYVELTSPGADVTYTDTTTHLDIAFLSAESWMVGP